MWQPSATIESLRARARLMDEIREFFRARSVLEVETPALSQATVTDVHLHPFVTHFASPIKANSETLYLMTSPEFHMKRLLSAGSGCIFQLSKAFRNEEQGKHHNPEFTMLEWYRVGFDHHALMDEMEQLLQTVLKCGPCERKTYQQAFIEHLALDPLTASLDELKAAAPEEANELAELEEDKDTLLQLLFSFCIEPHIGQKTPLFTYDFPASQAALARLNPDDPRVAERFEVYFKGIELANGFHELSDAKEQRQRFEADNQKRLQMGLPEQPLDKYFLDALAIGLPDCAGVALGVDRLLMLQLGASRIDQVISFCVDRA